MPKGKAHFVCNKETSKNKDPCSITLPGSARNEPERAKWFVTMVELLLEASRLGKKSNEEDNGRVKVNGPHTRPFQASYENKHFRKTTLCHVILN